MDTQSYSKPQWFLIYTKPHQEERAKENLENQGNEVFLPMIASEKTKQTHSFSLKPMFPRYLFAKFKVDLLLLLSLSPNLSAIKSSQLNLLNPLFTNLFDQKDFPTPDIPIKASFSGLFFL
mgnify:CR=1 FL=1